MIHLGVMEQSETEVRVHGTEFYNDSGFLAGSYFPELEAHKLMMTDVMEMYPHPDKSPPSSMDLNRKRKEPMEDREAPEDVKQVRLMTPDDQKKYLYHQDISLQIKDDNNDTRHLRQNHSEIEKRRRDKMNTYISELSSMIPTCKAMSRKMDKLTVLRLAVQHLKTIRGSLDSYTEGNYKPPMLTDKELKQLIIPCADGFLFVVDSARGRILYVSESVNKTLNFSHQDLMGQSLFDILHPKDIPKVKEQLSNCDSTPRERLIDSKTLLPVKGGDVPQSITRLHPGARRVFFCRMKCKEPVDSTPIKQEEEPNPGPMLNSGYSSGSSTSSTTAAGRKKKKNVRTDKRYLSIQCTGYLKSWPLTKIGLDSDTSRGVEEGTEESCMNCLVAVGRIQPTFQATIKDCLEKGNTTAHGLEFTSRHGTDGKFSYVDQRVTLLLGYLPQELTGTSLYEHIQYDDIPAISECHKNALKNPQEVRSPYFRFRAKDGKFVKLESKWKQFRNPWTKEIEYLVCKNYMLISNERMEGGGSFVGSGDMEFFQNGGAGTRSNGPSPSPGMGKDIQRVITSHADAAKIGRKIADEVIDKFRSDSSASNSPLSLQAPSPGLGLTSTRSTHGGSKDCSMDDSMRDAMAEVEKDRSQLSGVIVSRASTSGNTPRPGQDNTESRDQNRDQGTEAHSRERGPGNQGRERTSGGHGRERGLGTHGKETGPGRQPRGDPRVQEQQRRRGPQPGGGNMSLSEQIMQGAMNARSHSPQSSSASSEGNDEAAMAVIMSLLEADAGLGGPVDFSGLPWPLP